MQLTPLHIDLLIALRLADIYGLGMDNLLADMRRGRHRNVSEPDVQRALRDLADKTFVIYFDGALGQPRWRITAHGKTALEEANL